MERTVFFFVCLFVCLFVFTLTVRLSVPLACVRQRALAVQFEEVLFRQLYEATFNDEKVAWVVLTIECAILHLKKNANAQFNSLTHEIMAKLFDFKK